MRGLSLLLAVIVGAFGLSACQRLTTAPFAGYPTPAKVGTPAGWAPTSVHQGDLTITTPNTVVKDIEVMGSINVQADGTIIRRVRVHGRIWNQFYRNGALRQSSMRIVDSVIGDPSSNLEVTADGTVGPGRYTILRSELYGLDGFRVSEPNGGGSNAVSIQHNYFRSTQAACSAGFHLDGVQGYFGGKDVLVYHNTLDVRAPCGVNAGVFFADSSQSASVVDNLIVSGGFSLRIHDDNAPDVGPWIIGMNRIVPSGYGPVLTTNTECGNPNTMMWWDNRTATIDANYNITSTGPAVGC
jgi:hypothetical protein